MAPDEELDPAGDFLEFGDADLLHDMAITA